MTGLSEYQVNPSGGKIFVDKRVRSWLDSFRTGNLPNKTPSELSLFHQITKTGFEEDETISPPDGSLVPRISLVVVLFNSGQWVESLNKMFSNLHSWLYEIIVVDNGSSDNCLEKLKQDNIKIRKIPILQSVSYAAAVNKGFAQAIGDVFLLINPDIWIPRSSLWALIGAYNTHKEAAAIMPKLMLMKTPGFINSVGNHVPLFRWGYDQGLGHLDVGQFDHVEEIEAACFATVLIPREKWEIVGKLDEGYPMYYEDSDWCYRARVAGFSIRLASDAKVYHDFGGNTKGELISPKKLENVTYSRLRYVRKSFSKWKHILFVSTYLIFDLILMCYSFFPQSRSLSVHSIISGWKKYLSFHNSKAINTTLVPVLASFSSISPRMRFGVPKLVMNTIQSHKDSNPVFGKKGK